MCRLFIILREFGGGIGIMVSCDINCIKVVLKSVGLFVIICGNKLWVIELVEMKV